mgnify:CR=1 FL=1
MIYSLGIILLFGFLIGYLLDKIRIPGLFGMVIIGLILGPYCLDLIDGKLLDISSELRQIALVIILTRSGLNLDLASLKKIGKKATIISIFEALGGALGVMIALFIAYFAGLKNQGLTIPMILIFGSIACATAPAATLLVVRQYLIASIIVVLPTAFTPSK